MMHEVQSDNLSSQKILILYTGGTIGMQPSPEGYVPVAGFEQLLRKRLSQAESEHDNALPEFDVIECEQLIDSSNLMPHHWHEIAQHLQTRWQDYAGFVVLHGTDTMAYSASTLSFLFQGLNKPIIFTGSQIPLAERRNDALNNVITALGFAADAQLTDVCLYFNGRLLRGNRSRKTNSTAFEAFDSPNYPHLANVGIYVNSHTAHWLPTSEQQFTLPEFNPTHVAYLPMYPGITAHVIESILRQPDLKGVVMQNYGVGNPPDAHRELMAALAAAAKNDICIVNTTQCLQGPVVQGAYATGHALNQCHVVAGGDITPEAAFSKLHVLIANGASIERVRAEMARSICGEMTER